MTPRASTFGYILLSILIPGLLISSAVILGINSSRVPTRKAYKKQLANCNLYKNSQIICLRVWCTNSASWPQERCESVNNFEKNGYDPDYNIHFLTKNFPLDEDSPKKGWIALALICCAAVLQAMAQLLKYIFSDFTSRKLLSVKYKSIVVAFTSLGWMLLIVSATMAIIGSSQAEKSWGLYNTDSGLWISATIFSFFSGVTFLLYNILMIKGHHFLKKVQFSPPLPETFPLTSDTNFPRLSSPPSRACGNGMGDIIFHQQGGYRLLPQWQRNISSSQCAGTPITSSGTLTDQSISPRNPVYVGGGSPFSSENSLFRDTPRQENPFPLGNFPVSEQPFTPRPVHGPPWTDPRDDRQFNGDLTTAENSLYNRQKCQSLPAFLPLFSGVSNGASEPVRIPGTEDNQAEKKSLTTEGSTRKKTEKGQTHGYALQEFTLEELYVATEGFALKNKLGEGGFGSVFKGVLPDGSFVAVKKLHSDLGPLKTAERTRGFKAEIEIISRVHHKNLVRLVGYGLDNHDQGMLAYEFMSNGSLHDRLHGTNDPLMTWSTRLNIAIGAARGLAYLHDDCSPKILHRDVKAMNILLDSNYNAKVADFGLARLVKVEVDYVSTRVMGTFGYLAPDYAFSGQLTEKSDVYSFGVVLIELLTARKPIEQNTGDGTFISVVEWAWQQQTENIDPTTVVDPRLNDNFPIDGARRLWNCALCCIQSVAHKRPSMEQVLHMLLRCKEGSYLSGDYESEPIAVLNKDSHMSRLEGNYQDQNASYKPPFTKINSREAGPKADEDIEHVSNMGLDRRNTPNFLSSDSWSSRQMKRTCPQDFVNHNFSVTGQNSQFRNEHSAIDICYEGTSESQFPRSAGSKLKGAGNKFEEDPIDHTGFASSNKMSDHSPWLRERGGFNSGVEGHGQGSFQYSDVMAWSEDVNEETDGSESCRLRSDFDGTELGEVSDDENNEFTNEWRAESHKNVNSSPESVGTIFRGLLETAKVVLPGIGQSPVKDLNAETKTKEISDRSIWSGDSYSATGSGRMTINKEKRLSLTKLMQEEKYEEALSQLSSSGEWVVKETSENSFTAQGCEGQEEGSVEGISKRKRGGPGDMQQSRLREMLLARNADFMNG